MIIDASRYEHEPMPWARQALCSGADPDLWFPQRGDSTRGAIATCHQCPVETQCLDYALRWSIDFGVWGGTTPDQRRRMRSRRVGRPRLLPSPHGTTSRYAQGCRCDTCADANTSATRLRKQQAADQ